MGFLATSPILNFRRELIGAGKKGVKTGSLRGDDILSRDYQHDSSSRGCGWMVSAPYGNERRLHDVRDSYLYKWVKASGILAGIVSRNSHLAATGQTTADRQAVTWHKLLSKVLTYAVGRIRTAIRPRVLIYHFCMNHLVLHLEYLVLEILEW